MSVDDGLVMQLHAGSFRDHNEFMYRRFGPDRGADIPVATEFTHNLRPLLNAFGNDARFQLIVFTLDESTYSRELAPLAGHYPALLLGALVEHGPRRENPGPGSFADHRRRGTVPEQSRADDVRGRGRARGEAGGWRARPPGID